MRVYRFAGLSQNTIEKAMSGDGGLYGPARWHLKGHRIVYMGSTPAICLLELSAQDGGLKPHYHAYEVTVPDAVSRRPLDRTRLPKNWRLRSSYPDCQMLGVEWLTGENESALLLVPSAVSPLETNILLNPLHQDAKKITARALGIQSTDPRLLPAEE